MYKLEREGQKVDASLGFKDTVEKAIILPTEAIANYAPDYPTKIVLPTKLVNLMNERYITWQVAYADGTFKVFNPADDGDDDGEGWSFTTIWKELRK